MNCNITENLYVVDTSSFVELNEKYPQNISHFKSIWSLIEDLIKKGGLITHEFVLKELQKKDDEIYNWAKEWKRKKRNFVKKVDKFQFSRVLEIVNKYPKIAEVKHKDDPFHADPFVIALAIEEKTQIRLNNSVNVVIVCEESFNPSKPLEQNKIRIPRIAREYNVETTNFLGLLSREDGKQH